MSTSQRAASSTSLFASGSLPGKWLLLMFLPDLLGGSGSRQPAFLAQYNLTEVLGYVGLMPLVASFALVGRLRLRRPVPEWLVWHFMAFSGRPGSWEQHPPLAPFDQSAPLWGPAIPKPQHRHSRYGLRVPSCLLVRRLAHRCAGTSALAGEVGARERTYVLWQELDMPAVDGWGRLGLCRRADSRRRSSGIGSCQCRNRDRLGTRFVAMAGLAFDCRAQQPLTAVVLAFRRAWARRDAPRPLGSPPPTAPTYPGAARTGCR